MQSSQQSLDFEAGSPTPSADRLVNADVRSWKVDSSWRALLDNFWSSQKGQQLIAFLQDRVRAGAVIYPPQPLRALELTPLSGVKVVILGQDPYHGPGQAEGLAFSVAPGVRIPPSLRNIFKELHRDLGVATPADGSLAQWAREGVLLLNTSLTVEDGSPASHAKRGWETLTDSLIQAVSAQPHPVVFMLWGAHAQAKSGLIDTTKHLVLTANHPSPLSALRPPEPFIGCGHFSSAVRWLAERGIALKF